MRLALLCSLAVALVAASAHAKEREAKPGKVSLMSLTLGAEIFIDGTLRGRVPLEEAIELPAGPHHFALRKLGFSPLEQDFTLKPGQSIELEADLLAVAGVLRANSLPRGSDVLVDGVKVCETPCEQEVIVGNRTIELRSAGYETHKESFVIAAGNVYTVEATLKRDTTQPAPIIVSSVVAERTGPSAPAAPPKVLAPRSPPSWYQRWWVWAAVGAAVVTAASVAIVLGNSGSSDQPPDSPCQVWSLEENDTCTVGAMVRY